MKEAGGWLRANVAAVVTWAILLLGGAVAYGVTSAQIGQTSDLVDELRADGRVTTSDLATVRTDVRVLDSQQRMIVRQLDAVASSVDRLESVTTRLEALANGRYRGAPPAP